MYKLLSSYGRRAAIQYVCCAPTKRLGTACIELGSALVHTLYSRKEGSNKRFDVVCRLWSLCCFATIYIALTSKTHNNSVMQLLDRLTIGTLIVMDKPKDSRLGLKDTTTEKCFSCFLMLLHH
jgi:hypothetical protein